MRGSHPSTVLVTGGAGFIGCNLADRLAAQGHRVRILDALCRPGARDNLNWLAQRHGGLIEPFIGDIGESRLLSQIVRGVDAVFHFAAQVAVTTSMDRPRDDFRVNAAGTVGLLEAVRRHAPEAAVVFASTNKVYGDLSRHELVPTLKAYVPAEAELALHGVGEGQPLDFHTPYGCSKGAADQYVLDYARSYGLRSAVLRMSCIYGERQMGTEDQGWVAHFVIRALKGEPISLYGDGRQVRDVCDVADTCAAYLAVWRGIDRIAGQAFNWGGGPANAVSLLTVIDEIERLIGRKVDLTHYDWRPGDQRWFVADTRAIELTLGVAPRTPWREGLRNLTRWLEQRQQPEPLPIRAIVAGIPV